MDKFEQQFENLDVQSSYMETAMSDTTTLTVPQVEPIKKLVNSLFITFNQSRSKIFNNNNSSLSWRQMGVDICQATKSEVKFNIDCFSSTLRWIIIVLVYTTQVE